MCVSILAVFFYLRGSNDGYIVDCNYFFNSSARKHKSIYFCASASLFPAKKSITAVGRIIPPRSTGAPNAAQAVHTAAMTMPIMLTATATACVMAADVK